MILLAWPWLGLPFPASFFAAVLSCHYVTLVSLLERNDVRGYLFVTILLHCADRWCTMWFHFIIVITYCCKSLHGNSQVWTVRQWKYLMASSHKPVCARRYQISSTVQPSLKKKLHKMLNVFSFLVHKLKVKVHYLSLWFSCFASGNNTATLECHCFSLFF